MNIFLLRWNPNISSWKNSDFRQSLADSRKGPIGMDWSVREWEKLEQWDWAVLCRVGTDADGIVAIGWFDGRIEESESWRKDGSKCHYAFFWMSVVQDPSQTGLLLADTLERTVPGIDWHGGHSGIAVPSDRAAALACALSDALERGLVPPGAAPFSNPPYGPGELARSLRLAFCPESLADEFRRALPGHKITFHRKDTPDGESPDCGVYRIIVSNPHGGEPLRIDLGENETTLSFGGSHLYVFNSDEEWCILIDYAKKIVAGLMLSVSFSVARSGEWKWTNFNERIIRSDSDAFQAVVDGCANGAGGRLRWFAKAGAKLVWTSWKPSESGTIELSPSWFQTIARITALDAVLASHESEDRNENGMLSMFEFPAEAGRFTCQKTDSGLDGKYGWNVFLTAEENPSVAAPDFNALLESPLPHCGPGDTIREALSDVHAFDVEMDWISPGGIVPKIKNKPIDENGKTSFTAFRFEIAVPLDGIGLYGVKFVSTRIPARYQSISLTQKESESIFSFFTEINVKYGLHIDRFKEEILPSLYAADALVLLRGFCNCSMPDATRATAERILPVFEKAAKLRMPVCFWF